MFGLTQLQLSLAAGVLALGMFAGWLMAHDAKTVNKERARVESTGAKIDAKAQAKRANAAAHPDQALQKYWRD